MNLLMARSEIEQVVYRYCRGIDRLDRELVRGCYHPDATDEHGGFTGDRDEFVTWVFALLDRYTSTTHLIGNVFIEVDGEVALCESYGVATHRGPTGADFDPRLNLSTGFRYVDRFERRDGTWAIARRIALVEWSRVETPDTQWSVPDHHRRGARDRSDPVYWLVPEVRDD